MSNQAVDVYLAGDFKGAQDLLMPISEEPDNYFVLTNARLGSAALAAGDLKEAEAALLRAYEVMNSVGVNNGGRSAGAVLVDEKIRIWKGEPFERAMASFYLGLIYYMQGDYGNARGAIENALFKLRDYNDLAGGKTDEFNEVDSNFALGYLMLGKCWQRLGNADQARRAFERAVLLRPDLKYLADPAWNEASNVLLVIDLGLGPHKVTEFDGSVVGFAPDPAQLPPLPQPQLSINGDAFDLGGIGVAPVDLAALAQDRRWQSIDTIRAVKSALGTAAILGGAIATTSRDRNTQLVGLGAMAAGLALKATSQADTRGWDVLPRTTYLLPLKLCPGTYDLGISFPSGGRATIKGATVPATGEVTYYLRILSSGGMIYGTPLTGHPVRPY